MNKSKSISVLALGILSIQFPAAALAQDAASDREAAGWNYNSVGIQGVNTTSSVMVPTETSVTGIGASHYRLNIGKDGLIQETTLDASAGSGQTRYVSQGKTFAATQVAGKASVGAGVAGSPLHCVQPYAMGVVTGEVRHESMDSFSYSRASASIGPQLGLACKIQEVSGRLAMGRNLKILKANLAGLGGSLDFGPMVTEETTLKADVDLSGKVHANYELTNTEGSLETSAGVRVKPIDGRSPYLAAQVSTNYSKGVMNIGMPGLVQNESRVMFNAGMGF